MDQVMETIVTAPLGQLQSHILATTVLPNFSVRNGTYILFSAALALLV